MPLIGIILGSDSDLPKIQNCFETLDEFGVDYEIVVSSAHRSPERTLKWAMGAEKRGVRVIIAAAGGAAHLPGVVAAHTPLPVIGIPIETAISGGLDSILSIIQMPAGVPVAAMPAGKAGGANAALFALSVLALADDSLKEKIARFREKNAAKIAERSEKLSALGYRKYIETMK